MVQREVAERIAAPPGKMSYLSVFVQYHARVRIARPRPGGRLRARAGGRVGGHRRRAVRGRRPPRRRRPRTSCGGSSGRLPRAPQDAPQRPVAPAAGRRRDGSTAALAAADIDPDRRPQTLAVGEWLALREALGPIGPDGRGKRGVRATGTGVTAVDPLRRLTPVVRLAPAKLNLTLAVIGRRDDGYHSLHSVFVPLALADRLSLAPAAGGQDTLHVSGLDAGPPADNLVLPGDRRGPHGGRWRLAGRSGSGPGARRPPREADPGRGRAGRRLVGRGRHARRRARGVGRRPRRRDASARRRESRLGRAVLPRRRPGPRRGPRRDGHAAPWPARRAGRPARHPGHRRRRRRTSSPPSTRSGSRATARSGCRRRTWPRSCGRACRRRGPRGPGGRARIGQRPAARDGPRRPGPRAVQARADPAARPADRAVRLRPDPVGALSFGDARPPRPPSRPSSPARRRPRRPGRREPFVAATAIVGHPRRRTGMTRRPSRPRSTGRHRAVQPGHRQRRPPVLLRSGRPRPGDRRARRGWHRARDRAGDGQPDRRPRRGRRAPGTTSSRRRSSSSTWTTSRRSTRIYGRFVGDPPPARSTVGVAALPKGARVEIEVVAGAVDTPKQAPLRCRDP